MIGDIRSLIQATPEIEKKLGYSFKNKNLLLLAFVHRSFINENREVNEHNERLEFLGDSILGFLMADYLYCEMPSYPEGELSSLRSRLVEAQSCRSYIEKLHIHNYILLGKGERISDGRGRDSILADFCEALIGAIYLDGGIESAKTFIFSHFLNDMQTIIKTPTNNWKAILQDYCQKNFQQPPTYTVLEENGPDHSKQFKILVSIAEKPLGHGEGLSKKEAQQAAAANALSKIKN